jgi:hypothetical protein
MKRAFLSLLAAFLALGGFATARDLKTVNGDVYKNVVVQSKDATGIQIEHDDGVAYLDFKKLSEADQKDFGYTPESYAAGWKQKYEAERQRRVQAELAAQQAIARAKALAAAADQGNAPAQETWQPTNQTGLQVTVDSPGFSYGGFPVGGVLVPGFTTVIPAGRGRNVAPYPYGYNGASWGPLQIRQR